MSRNLSSESYASTYWTVDNHVPTLCVRGTLIKLPTVSSEFKPLVEMMGISYKEKFVTEKWMDQVFESTVLEIFDDSFLEEVEVTAPVIIKQGSDKVCMNHRYTEKTYTEETIKHANSVYEMVASRIPDFKKWLLIKECLDSKPGVVAVGNFGLTTEIVDLFCHRYGTYQLCFKDYRANHIGLSTKPYMTVIVNLDKADSSSVINVTVPFDVPIGKVVGAGGWQAKEISDFFKVKKIQFTTE